MNMMMIETSGEKITWNFQHPRRYNREIAIINVKNINFSLLATLEMWLESITILSIYPAIADHVDDFLVLSVSELSTEIAWLAGEWALETLINSQLCDFCFWNNNSQLWRDLEWIWKVAVAGRGSSSSANQIFSTV